MSYERTTTCSRSLRRWKTLSVMVVYNGHCSTVGQCAQPPSQGRTDSSHADLDGDPHTFWMHSSCSYSLLACICLGFRRLKLSVVSLGTGSNVHFMRVPYRVLCIARVML
jgi:hypothetical protein